LGSSRAGFPDVDHPGGSAYAFILDKGGTLDLGGQAFSIDSLTLTASGATNTFNNGTLTVGSVSVNNAFTGSASLFATSFTATRSSIALAGGITVTGQLSLAPLDNFSSISLATQLTIASQATATLASTDHARLAIPTDGSLDKQGSFTAGLGTLSLSSSSSIHAPTFLNSGTLIIDPGQNKSLAITAFKTFGSAVAPVFQNPGSVEVRSGAFELHAPDNRNTQGTFAADAGATSRPDGALTFSATSSI
jgi:hypothetical protein